MPLVDLRRQGSAGPIVFVLLFVGVVILLILTSINTCPEGFVRQCVNVIWGKLTGAACECVAAD